MSFLRPARHRATGRLTGLVTRARSALSQEDPGAWDPQADGDLLDWLGFTPARGLTRPQPSG